jgi:hypothetical protein
MEFKIIAVQPDPVNLGRQGQNALPARIQSQIFS